MAIRWHLFLAAASTCLPLLLLTVWLGIAEVQHTYQILDEEADRIAATVRQTLDADLAAKLSGLMVLAASHSANIVDQNGRLADFYDEATVFARRYGSHVALKNLDGQVVFHTAQPLGVSLPDTNTPDTLAQLVVNGQPQVTDVFVGSVLGRPMVNLDVPVERNGLIHYVLSLNLYAEDVQQMVMHTEHPDGWGIAILDTQGRFVARSRNPATGELARPALVEAVKAQRTERVETITREGIAVVNILVRSHTSPWTMVVGVPKADLQRPVTRLILMLATAILIASVLGGVLALFHGKRIAAAVSNLATDGPPHISGIPEIDAVARRIRMALDDLQASERHHRNLARDAEAHRRKAEQASHAKSQFLAAASHDLRQPTQSLMLFAGALAETFLQPEQRTFVTHIERSLEALKMMLDGILDLSRCRFR